MLFLNLQKQFYTTSDGTVCLKFLEGDGGYEQEG